MIVTEGLECLEQDVLDHLDRRAPRHPEGVATFISGTWKRRVAWARMRGYFATFPVAEGRIVRGGRQRIYFVQYDGPLLREIAIEVLGE